MTKQIEAYRDTLQDIEKTLGEIDLERARYLLNTDELLEEILGETRDKITDNVESSREETVQYGELVSTELVA